MAGDLIDELEAKRASLRETQKAFVRRFQPPDQTIYSKVKGRKARLPKSWHAAVAELLETTEQDVSSRAARTLHASRKSLPPHTAGVLDPEFFEAFRYAEKYIQDQLQRGPDPISIAFDSLQWELERNATLSRVHFRDISVRVLGESERSHEGSLRIEVYRHASGSLIANLYASTDWV